MAQCKISIPLSDSPTNTALRAEAAIRKAGGTFAGDAAAGSFGLRTPLGAIQGSYTQDAASIHIIITEKPLFLGCGTIEKELVKYLSR